MGMFGSIALLMIATMFGGAIMDMSMYHTHRNQLQSTTDSAALAGASMLFSSTAPTEEGRQSDATTAAENFAAANLQQIANFDPEGDVTLGHYDVATKTFSTSPDNDDTTLSATGGYNAVRVQMTANEIPTMFSKLLGITDLQATQASVAMANPPSPPLRPFVTCQGQLDEALKDGNMSNNVIRNYKKNFYVDNKKIRTDCPKQAQWGFYNFAYPGQKDQTQAQLAEWIAEGYSGSFIANDPIYAQEKEFIQGNLIPDALDDLIAAGEPIDVPLIDDTFVNSQHSNAQGRVTKVAHFLVTDYKSTGPKNFHYIEGHFVSIGPLPTGKAVVKLVRPQ